jgi:hypothetical protein
MLSTHSGAKFAKRPKASSESESRHRKLQYLVATCLYTTFRHDRASFRIDAGASASQRIQRFPHQSSTLIMRAANSGI